MLLPDLARSGDAALAADNILDALSRQMEVAGAALSVDATVGIACAPSHAQEADLLLQRAEAAMYRAKRAQSRREFFSLDIEDEAPRRLILVTALKRAIDARAITMHYQPKVALAHRRVIGVEALARWTDEVVGPVLPATFVPLAERTASPSRSPSWRSRRRPPTAAAGRTTATTPRSRSTSRRACCSTRPSPTSWSRSGARSASRRARSRSRSRRAR